MFVCKEGIVFCGIAPSINTNVTPGGDDCGAEAISSSQEATSVIAFSFYKHNQ